MKQTDQTTLCDLELPAVFPENRTPVSPFADQGELPRPDMDIVIPLPKKKFPPRVVIVDDDKALIESLGRSQKAYYRDALDVLFWHPDNEVGLVDQITEWMRDGWRPDAVVIDINMDIGGRHGIHYLQELRQKEGCAALAVVLATANTFRDLEEGRVTAGATSTNETPSQWFEKAHLSEPEAIIYGKTAAAVFLGRIGEHLSEWRRAARRRAWVKLLTEVAKNLDGPSIKVKIVAKEIVQYAVRELSVDDAFVRWRQDDYQYELVAADTTRSSSYVEVGNTIDPRNVPLLNEILGKDREPVVKLNINKVEAGLYSQYISDYRFLGVEMVLGNRSVGFITLLRASDKEAFETDIDGQYLAVLARLLASALGRDALMRSRQTRLLTFANCVAQATKVEDVCEALVTTLHQELHSGDDAKAKSTVRLLDFGQGILHRLSHRGMASKEENISITDRQSIYADCVRDNKLFRIENVCASEWVAHYKNLCEIGGVRSELCVPLSIGDHAIGAVNNEHLDLDYYRIHDDDFVRAAAGLAASAIERIRATQVLDGMTDFVHRFSQDKTEELDRRLRKLLYEFCGYSVLVDLELTSKGQWTVRHVESKFQGASKEDVRNQIQNSYADRWEQTWVSKLYFEKEWERNWAHYTKNVEEFFPVILAKEDENEFQQQADALLWLRRDESPPHRALLLMWYLPPPMNDTSVTLLGSLARLFSELDSRQQHIRDLVEQILIGEQAAQIGYVMQHFRHRLGNLTGSLSTHIDRVETAHSLGDEDRFELAMQDLRNNAKAIANSFHKSRGYVKKPEETWVQLQEMIEKTINPQGLAERLQDVDVQIEMPATLQVWTDLEIASLALYSLFENALDAVEGQACKAIRLCAEMCDNKVMLSVSDNGPGVAESVRPKLFEWGVTTKSDGLGSALAFARARMRALHGDLLFPQRQPSSGALFEMYFPSEPKEPNK